MARKKNPVDGEAKAARKPAKGGKSRGKRKLTDEQVLAIVTTYTAGGITMTNLAKLYEISAPTVSSIVNGRTYSWLTRIGLDMAALADAA